MATENLDVHRYHLKRSFLHIAIDKGNNSTSNQGGMWSNTLAFGCYKLKLYNYRVFN